MLYDINDNAFDPTGFKYFNEGKCAKLFIKDNVVLKRYKFECPKGYQLSTKVFNILKDLNLNSLVKLYNYYYDNKKSVFRYIELPETYTMEYIDNPHIKLLNQDKEYLLDIITNLERDINVLANNKIAVYDAHCDNIIFRENDAKIIDIDSFTRYKLINEKRVLLNNRKELLYYIESTLKEELKEKDLYNYKFEYFFNNDVLVNTTVTDYLDKRLSKGRIEDNFHK